MPVTTAYNQWTQFEEFPKFMSAVKRVEQLDDETLERFKKFIESRHAETGAWRGEIKAGERVS